MLPFANRSNVDEDQFFTDGIHDDLLTQLAKISTLKVISRTSVMKYKSTEKTIPEITQQIVTAIKGELDDEESGLLTELPTNFNGDSSGPSRIHLPGGA